MGDARQTRTGNAAGSNAHLAIDGGPPVRTAPMPAREAIGPNERALLFEALDHYQSIGADPGFQGLYERRYCAGFAEFMGGGYADAVATGTAAIYVSLAALELPKGSQVIVSPITDPGTLSAIILNGLVPTIADSMPNSYNIGVAQVAERIGEKTSCILVVHSIGQAADIEGICGLARTHGVKVLEDCSQSHGAIFAGRRIGSFGDIAAFSTMYRKASIAGSSGGVVFTRDRDLFRTALAHADRGKPSWRDDFDDRDPGQFIGPALNLHTDELSSAIGIATLARLDETRQRRLAFVKALAAEIDMQAKVCRAYPLTSDDSPFVFPVFVDEARVTVSKKDFALAVREEGIGLNPDYRYLVVDWPWIGPYLADEFSSPNARRVRDATFNLYLNEAYGMQEVADIIAAIKKVEAAYLKT